MAMTSDTAGLKCAPEIRPEREDQDDEDGAGGDGVAEQREGEVTPRKLLRHDAGADHSGDEEPGAERLGGHAPRSRPVAHGSVAAARERQQLGRRALDPADVAQALPQRHLIERRERQVEERVILFLRYLAACTKARSFSMSEPSTAAGSSMPQCAVAGCPGHNGQASPAALSQTVKMKSISGAPGRANSSQLFDR